MKQPIHKWPKDTIARLCALYAQKNSTQMAYFIRPFVYVRATKMDTSTVLAKWGERTWREPRTKSHHTNTQHWYCLPEFPSDPVSWEDIRREWIATELPKLQQEVADTKEKTHA